MIKKIEHVAIIVQDMEKSIDYYRQLFGFQVRTRDSNATREMVFLYLPEHPEVEIELIRDLVPGEEYATQSVVNHLAFTVENIEQAMAYYRDKGVEFTTEQPKQGAGGAKILFFYGPNKELLQLVQPAHQV